MDKKKKHLENITAVERDGFDIRVLTISLNVEEGVDLKDAIQKASIEFCQTEEGRKIYEYNYQAFNLADFEMHVPNSICQKYGIEKLDSITMEEDMDWDEQLVNLSDVYDLEQEQEY
jgi:hypothetical protein